MKNIVGKTISHYHILGKLGEGGMGIVYKAEDIRLKRLVALKFLPHHLTRDNQAARRFTTEAQAASALDHQNICTIYEIDETEDGQMFITMAHYEGETLQEKIAKGPLSTEEATDIIIQIARGLSKAHQKNIIHRDIKPGNIIVQEDGTVKIIDFGLSKLLNQRDITKTDIPQGTVGYMSPEQAQGRKTDHHTDIWSVGVLLYEMLTGELPFEGGYDQVILYNIVNSEPKALNELRPDLPDEWQSLIDKALNKNQDARYQTIDELIADLQSLQRGEVGKKRKIPIQRFSFSKKAVKLSFVLILLLVTFGAISQFLIRSEVKDENTSINLSERVVAIFPFSFRGNPELNYLGEGMADLLNTALDGAGELRSVDPNALLSHLKREQINNVDLESGYQIASHFGAGNYILGFIVEAGEKLRVGATLYNTTKKTIITNVTIEGNVKELFTLIDRLTSQLLAGQLTRADTELSSLTHHTTDNLEALKAYLQGVHDERTGHLVLSFEAFQRATELDSTFALAWLRLAFNAFEWQLNFDAAREAASKAIRHKERLSEHGLLKLEAMNALLAGDITEALRVLRSIVAKYPDDARAWSSLGSVLLFANPMFGKSITEARFAKERAMFYQPDFAPYYQQLSVIALRERKSSEFDSLRERLVAISSNQDWFWQLEATNVFLKNDPIEQKRFSDEATYKNDALLKMAVMCMSQLIEDLDAAITFASALANPSRSPSTQGEAHLILSNLYAGKGQLNLAKQELALAANLETTKALSITSEAFLTLFPFHHPPKDDLKNMSDRLKIWNVENLDEYPSTMRVYRYYGMYYIIKNYLLGMLELHQGDKYQAINYAEKIEQAQVHPDIGSLGQDLGTGIRAQIARAEGNEQKALEILQRVSFKRIYFLFLDRPFHSCLYDRWQRAELLNSFERYDEALSWYEAISEHGAASLFLAPSHLRRAEIYEKLNQTDKSIQHYEKFIDLWEDADTQFQPKIEEARKRVAILQKKLASL
ncbi:MAG: protein kinase [Calditrichaceae bacterium]|nr:protein kinase [Calditrichia bacterium]NUQ41081.1 protein kinase [Calditrichaceae bacterium]